MYVGHVCGNLRARGDHDITDKENEINYQICDHKPGRKCLFRRIPRAPGEVIHLAAALPWLTYLIVTCNLGIDSETNHDRVSVTTVSTMF